jgi:hypothetical protein
MINFEPKRILCPVDFSEQSAAALRVAGGIAKAVNAELIILHVQHVEAPVYFTAAQAQTLKASSSPPGCSGNPSTRPWEDRMASTCLARRRTDAMANTKCRKRCELPRRLCGQR